MHTKKKDYRISSLGRVQRLIDGEWKDLHKSICGGKGRDCVGYYHISINGKTISLHRLVALYFVPNDDPKHKTDVSHLDDNKWNNKASNLMWQTHKENCNSGIRNKLISINGKGKSNEKRPIVQLDKEMNPLAVYPSILDAVKTTGVDISYISSCVNHRLNHRSAFGYYFFDYKEYLSLCTDNDVNVPYFSNV